MRMCCSTVNKDGSDTKRTSARATPAASVPMIPGSSGFIEGATEKLIVLALASKISLIVLAVGVPIVVAARETDSVNPAPPSPKKRVLILCTGNSCRSQLAEALWRHEAGDRWEVFSAGVDPKGINPRTGRVLKELSIS